MKKVFLMFLLSLYFGTISFVLWTGKAGAQPFPGGLVTCVQNLNTCNADLGTCNADLAASQASLNTCNADLGTCEDDLEACEAQPDAPVAQTGQTTCWNSSGTVIPCAGTGQDGDIQAGVVPPNPRFMDNGNGTITDNLTGLIWLKDANCFGTSTWAEALTDANTLNSGECGLTDGSVEGDWYLPNRNELASLVEPKNSNPALPTGHLFTNVQLSFYWTSTTFALTPNFAWTVSFNFGAVDGNFFFKTSSFRVLPVRGGA